jgi:hypothetical protein
MKRYVANHSIFLKLFLSDFRLAFIIIHPFFMKADKIHATVRKSLVRHFQSKIHEGSLYEVEQVLVGFNEGPFKVTSHKHKITMMQHSRWTRIQDDLKVPLNSFQFESFGSILQAKEEDKTIGNLIEI